MSYGYGRNDSDNWDTDPYGRPMDPDDDGPPIKRIRHPKPHPEDVKDGDCVNCGAPKSHPRHHPFASFKADCCVFSNGKPLPPMNLYGAEVACIEGHGHMLGGDSGTGKCLRCGFTWQRLSTMTGHCVVGTGAVVLDVGQARTALVKGARLGTGT